jgi:hypothetical protein
MNRPITTITSWRRLLLCLVLALTAVPAGAEGALGGELVVQSATATFNRGVILLDAEIRYPLTTRISEALKSGVNLEFELEISFVRPRRLWFNADVFELTLRREMAYHVISDRYVISDPQDGSQETFPTLQAALERLGHITDQPIAVEAQLRGSGPWQVNLRAGVRRGRIPDALRFMMFWSDDWHRTSDWYTWTFER